MKHLYLCTMIYLIMFAANSQETITISGYDGTATTIDATSNVNQTITIVFEDADIVQNFYTENRASIFMYGGLDTDAGGFQGAPDFGDLSSQPELLLTDGDSATAPNTYNITINLAQFYSSIPNGTTVYGFNFLFQNEFGGGGNNQSADLYINLVDAPKDDTLSIASFNKNNFVSFIGNELVVSSASGDLDLSVYDNLGRAIKTLSIANSESGQKIDLGLEKDQIYIVKVSGETQSKTLKFISM
ncbi:MAG: T9SS type A sorting domain-containing protein [Psychroserpens sp.]|uniref:T9SS type A sorting domain-containing protein n=1 Tax=Psychroserpens sp. TaxID=2020870 RepID=UPI003CA4FCE6